MFPRNEALSLATFEDVFEQWGSLDTAAGFSFPGKNKNEVMPEIF